MWLGRLPSQTAFVLGQKASFSLHPLDNSAFCLVRGSVKRHAPAVPTVLRAGPYRFFFYSADGHEPPHVHVARDRAKAKFWLEPVAFVSSSDLNARELRDVQSLIVTHQTLLLTAWHDYFGSR